MIQEKDVLLLVQTCEQKLGLNSIELNREYGYGHLPLCVIDAVFSMGVSYSSTRNTVARFCDFFAIPPGHSKNILAPDAQLGSKVRLSPTPTLSLRRTRQMRQNIILICAILRYIQAFHAKMASAQKPIYGIVLLFG